MWRMARLKRRSAQAGVAEAVLDDATLQSILARLSYGVLRTSRKA